MNDALILSTPEEVRLALLSSRQPSLDELQEFVGGYIEIIPISASETAQLIVCEGPREIMDERRARINRLVSSLGLGFPIYGDAVLLYSKGLLD